MTMAAPSTLRTAPIARVDLKVGLEIHVELSAASKMFSRIGSVAHRQGFAAQPNTLIDPLTLGLPGSLPVLNQRAIEMSIRVGLALGCSIATISRWDRKSYFYPDMPKNYQISQYDLPLCFDGMVTLPAIDERGVCDWARSGRQIGIIRAHLEEDAGKLLHELPGGAAVADASVVDFNRAGTALLEIVTAPDFRSAEEVVVFAQQLRNICRTLGVTEGIMQRGHMRFEPNINCELHFSDGQTVATPIVEVKNLNSFRAVRSAILHELAHQPNRWRESGITLDRGTKTTRGWDDAAEITFVQREKEEASDYRYFPDPDLLPVRIDASWVMQTRDNLPEMPAARRLRYTGEFTLGAKEVEQLVDEPAVCRLLDAAAAASAVHGISVQRAGRQAANILLQSGAKRANELTSARDESAGNQPVLISDLGVLAEHLGELVAMREQGEVNSNAVDELFGSLCAPHAGGPALPLDGAASVRLLASARGLIVMRDDAEIERWCIEAVSQQPQAAADVRAGKQQAIGRLVGAAMKVAAGRGDAAQLREVLLRLLGGSSS